MDIQMNTIFMVLFAAMAIALVANYILQSRKKNDELSFGLEAVYSPTEGLCETAELIRMGEHNWIYLQVVFKSGSSSYYCVAGAKTEEEAKEKLIKVGIAL